jgi:tetratricopeptide (TPR) repeat protein
MLIATAIVIAAIVIFLLVYMLAQKPVTTAQQLIQMGRYEEAAAHPTADALHQAEALKLLGRYEEAIAAYRRSDDPAAKEGIALSLAHLGRNLDEAQKLMETQIALYPQIQEFQALGLAYILLRQGKRDEALRLYRDNVELLETRFRDDYTDRDPLLAETLMMYAELEEAGGDAAHAQDLRFKAKQWSATSPAGETLPESSASQSARRRDARDS